MRKIAIVTAVGIAVAVGAAIKVATGEAGWHGLSGEAINVKRLCQDGIAYRWAGFETENGEKPPDTRPVGVARWIGPFDIVVQGGNTEMPDDAWIGPIVGADTFVARYDPVQSTTDQIWHPYSHSGLIPFWNPSEQVTSWVRIDTDPNVESADNVILPVGTCHLFGRLDVVPTNPSNSVQLAPGARVIVALLSTAGFKAANVAAASTRFGQTGTEAVAVSSTKVDVNGDGRKDLRLKFAVGQTGLKCDSTFAELSAKDPVSKKTFYEADAATPMPPC